MTTRTRARIPAELWTALADAADSLADYHDLFTSRPEMCNAEHRNIAFCECQVATRYRALKHLTSKTQVA